jgi:hypothetical protein
LITNFLNDDNVIIKTIETIPGQLTLVNLLENNYVEESITRICDELKNIPYEEKIFDSILYSLTAFFTAIKLEKSILSLITEKISELLNNKIDNDTFKRSVDQSSLELSDQYPSDYFKVLDIIKQSIIKNRIEMNL